MEVSRGQQNLRVTDASSGMMPPSSLQPQRSSRAAAFTEAFLASSLQQPDNQDLKNLLTHKAVILGYTRPKKQRTKRSSKKAKGLTAQQKKALKVFQIRPEHQRSVRDGSRPALLLEAESPLWSPLQVPALPAPS